MSESDWLSCKWRNIMGMRVASSGASWASQSASSVSNYQTRQQGLKDLFSTLKAADLSGAQKAYSEIAKVSKIDPNSTLGQLGKALAEGDLSAAEKLATSMQASRSSSVTAAQTAAQAQNQQVASVLATLRGQGGNINLMA
jgi:hypothetical protein